MVDGGTGRAAQSIDRPVAGKTGTKDREDDIVSAWFVGYTRQISTAVMYVAGNGGNAGLDPYARPGDSTFFGGTYPALTWAEYMAMATEGQPVEDFGRAGVREPGQVLRADTAPSRPETQEPTEEPSETEEPEPTTPIARTGADGDRDRDRAPSRSAGTDEPPGLAATVEHPPGHAEPRASKANGGASSRRRVMAAPPGVPYAALTRRR